MAVLVCFHAHPDDEAIATSGSMAKAKAAGHRVVLVVATRGEHGEVADGFLEDGEQLGLRRVRETFAAAELIGADRVELLGYVDSGMMGEPTNDEPYSFWRADVEQAAHRLAAILREEHVHGPIVLTIYDDHGGYGHPDHIQVHRVGKRAAELAGVERVFQNTMNRTAIAQMMAEARENPSEFSEALQERMEEDVASDDTGEPEFGEPEENLTHAIDVSGYVDVKHKAMRAHASQITEDSFFMLFPPDVFARAFGTEWYMALGGRRAPDAPFGDDLFAGLA
jgi:LmbE family N-acetylglucosaminyl deacetylase